FLLPYSHSSPTRRSSDLECLTLVGGKLFCLRSRRLLPFECPPQALLLTIGRRPAESPIDSPGFPRSIQTSHPTSRFFLGSREQRSEEHTSELQSRGHLVC